MEEPVRVRMVFEDRHVLSKPQRSEGLKRCWVLLRPEHATVADLASHLTHSFGLQRSCPHGIVLSMDGFVLPSFESTCIFTDKDIIRVRRKGGSVKEVIKIDDDGYRIQGSEIVEKQPILSSNKLLAFKEFQEDSEGYKSKDEDGAYAVNENAILMENLLGENTNSKRKRKHSNIYQGSKRKKLKLTSLEKQDITTKDAVNNDIERNQSFPKRVTTCKSSHRKDKPSNEDDKSDALVVSQADDVENTPSPVPREKRKKKLKPTSLEKQDITTKDAENNHIERSQCSFPKRVATLKSSHKKDKPSKGDDRSDALVVSQADDSVENLPSSVLREERHDLVEINCQRNTCEPHLNGVKEKFPSRSTRRKKAKRRWCREMANSQMKEHIESQVPTNDMHRKSPEHQKMNLNNEVEDEIVPFIVRPGHIRFEPIDAEQSKQHSNGPMETLQWNGTTSKKKGQKWGQEKSLSGMSDDNACNKVSNGKFIAGDGNLVDDHIDFESLHFLSRPPKEGDVIVYRIVELSSSWCPELSSFRVGKVSSYDSLSMKIVLVPVPEHPIFPGEEKVEEFQPDVSPYKEDGSLEIDYPSLHDVRLFKDNSSEEIAINILRIERTEEAAPVRNSEVASSNNKVKERAATPMGTPVSNCEVASGNNSLKEKAAPPTGTPVSNWEVASANGSVKEKVAPPEEMRQDVGWEQINQALSEKKAELLKNDGWDNWTPNKDTYRALRRGALGPTVALLRGRGRGRGRRA